MVQTTNNVTTLDFTAILGKSRIQRTSGGMRRRVRIDGFSARRPDYLFVSPVYAKGRLGAQVEVPVASVIWRESDFYGV